MSQPNDLTDAAVLRVVGERIAMRRLQMNRTQADLAREAGVSTRTLIRLESGESTQLTNLIRVIRALGLVGNIDALIPASLASPMEQWRSRAKERRRASSKKKRSIGGTTPWAWQDDTPPRSETP